MFGSLAARFAMVHGGSLRQMVIWSAPAVGDYRMPAGMAMAAVVMGIRPSRRNVTRFARWPFRDLDQFRENNPAWSDLFFSYPSATSRTWNNRSGSWQPCWTSSRAPRGGKGGSR